LLCNAPFTSLHTLTSASLSSHSFVFTPSSSSSPSLPVARVSIASHVLKFHRQYRELLWRCEKHCFVLMFLAIMSFSTFLCLVFAPHSEHSDPPFPLPQLLPLQRHRLGTLQNVADLFCRNFNFIICSHRRTAITPHVITHVSGTSSPPSRRLPPPQLLLFLNQRTTATGSSTWAAAAMTAGSFSPSAANSKARLMCTSLLWRWVSLAASVWMLPPRPTRPRRHDPCSLWTTTRASLC
jgi:hypothetical protein